MQGFDSPRPEVSGDRFWSFIATKWNSADCFFRDCFVLNYCPLAFLSETGKNITPSEFRWYFDWNCLWVCSVFLNEWSGREIRKRCMNSVTRRWSESYLYSKQKRLLQWVEQWMRDWSRSEKNSVLKSTFIFWCIQVQPIPRPTGDGQRSQRSLCQIWIFSSENRAQAAVAIFPTFTYLRLIGSGR